MNFDSAIKQSKKVKWERCGKFTMPYLMAYLISEVMATPHLSPLGFKEIFKSWLFIDGEEWWDNRDHQNILKRLEKFLHKKDASFLLDFLHFNERETQRALRDINNLTVSPIDSLNNKELATVFHSWFTAIQLIIHLNVIFIPFDEAIEPIVQLAISKFVKGKENAQLLSELVYPKQLAYVIQEEDDLLAIAQEITKDKVLFKKLLPNSTKSTLDIIRKYSPEIFRKINNHCQKYAWLSVADWWGPLFTIDYFMDRIISSLKKDPGAVLKRRKKERLEKEKYISKRLKEINAPKTFVDMLGTIRDLLDLKQKQWDVVSISGYRARPLLTLIGQRLGGLTYEQVLQLTYFEIEELLTTNKKVDKGIIKDRLAHIGILRLGSKTYLFKGEEVIKLKNRLFPKQVKLTTNIIKGSPSYAGIVSGKVRIIPTLKELSTMQEGEILVCPMTNPDYMPAIRKARGIVTDEGGILCHAAIVSRELKIPCIVGTKIATQVLKDGDLVEVDADKGIVKIIERA